MLTREQELKIFRAVCGADKVVTSQHANCCNGNSVYAGNFNQGVAKAKLKEFVEKRGLDFEYWKNL